jgi:hypothetical protein
LTIGYPPLGNGANIPRAVDVHKLPALSRVHAHRLLVKQFDLDPPAIGQREAVRTRRAEAGNSNCLRTGRGYPGGQTFVACFFLAVGGVLVLNAANIDE